MNPDKPEREYMWLPSLALVALVAAAILGVILTVGPPA